MNTDTIVHIPLTGEESHVVSIPAGQGSMSIGTKGISKGKHEIWVEKDQPINWDAFNELYTPYGKQNMERYSYGDWPRFFYYSGNDMGFVELSLKRPTSEREDTGTAVSQLIEASGLDIPQETGQKWFDEIRDF